MDSSFNLFPTLVLSCPQFISEEERIKIFGDLKNRNAVSHGAVMGGKSSHALENNIIFSLGLEEKIQQKLDDYTAKVGIGDVKIQASWFNMQDQGSLLQQHCHAGSLLSAALYINVDGDSSSLTFENPNPNVDTIWASCREDGTDYNYTYYEFIPKNGDLYIFPSWLRHGSYYKPNYTIDRTVISLNAC